jgi:hypothetical protein
MQAIPALAAITPSTLSLVSAGVTAVGTIYGAMANSQAANYQAKIAERNADLAEYNAQQATNEAAVASRDSDMEAKAVLAQLLADQAGSGFHLDSTSFGLQRKGAEELAARDRARTTYAGASQANRYRQQGADFKAQAGLARMQGRQAMVGGILNTGGSLLSSAGKIQSRKAAQIRRTY